MNFFFITNIFILIFSVIAIINFNPIFAVLSMIVAFLLAVFYFAIMGAYLVSIIFLIVYVGAVAILFVFSLMLFERVLLSFSYFFFSVSFIVSFFYIIFFSFINTEYFSSIFEFEVDFFNNILFTANGTNSFFLPFKTFSSDYNLQVSLFDFGYPYIFVNGLILFFFTVAVGFIFSGSKGSVKFLF